MNQGYKVDCVFALPIVEQTVDGTEKALADMIDDELRFWRDNVTNQCL